MKNLVLAVILFFHLLVLAAQKTKDEQIRDLLPFEEIGHSIASATAEQIPFFHSYPGLTDRQLEDIIRHFIDSGKQDFIDSLSNIFDRLFTPEEIQQLQESFNSPAGEKYRSLLPLITGKSIRAIYSWYLSNQDHISNMIDSIYNETGYQIREDFTYTEIEFKKGKPYRFRKKPGSKSVYQNPANRFRIYYDSKIWNEIDPEALSIHIGEVQVLEGGQPAEGYEEKKAEEVMKRQQYDIQITVGEGDCEARIRTCDLTEEYIRINARYRS